MNRARIEALWVKNPSLTIREVVRLTGARWSLVKSMHAQLVAAGKLAKARRPPEFLRAV